MRILFGCRQEGAITEARGGRFETFDANARFVIVRDDDGYGVWRLDELGDGDPIERFADTDAGYQRAADTWRALTREDRRKQGVVGAGPPRRVGAGTWPATEGDPGGP